MAISEHEVTITFNVVKTIRLVIEAGSVQEVAEILHGRDMTMIGEVRDLAASTVVLKQDEHDRVVTSSGTLISITKI